MTDSDWLAGLKALEAAATPGPWEIIGYEYDRPVIVAGGSFHAKHRAAGLSEEDTAFIATSRNIFPELLAVINEARLLDQCALGSWECNCQNCRTLRAIDALAGKVGT